MGNRRLGLDELMIVNPDDGSGDALLLGDDGELYRVEGLGQPEPLTTAKFFLGDDGVLYQLRGMGGSSDHEMRAETPSNPAGQQDSAQRRRLFLGSDGALYEITE